MTAARRSYDGGVDHYEVLGVRADAGPDEIKRAYLALAREHHPDLHVESPASSRRASEQRMRDINAAWQVLGVESSRADYDRARSGVASPPATRIHRPSSEFTPYFDEDEDDDDSWRYEPDEGDPDTVPPRTLLIAPPALFVVGLVVLVVSLTTGIDELAAVGLACLVFSALLFVGAPVVAMFRSQMVEERSQHRR